MNDKKNDAKKGFSGNFVLFLIAAIFLIMMVQSFLETKAAKVSFSYELEHLVNLELIQSDESRKTAINDSLVTFSGHFRDKLNDEAKTRYKYLELLNANHELYHQKDQLERELTSLRGKIAESADLFIHLTGQPIPPGGYVVIDDIYTSQDKDNSLVINQLSRKNITSLRDVQSEFEKAKGNPTPENLQQVGKSLSQLVHNFRSPLLGIGNEVIKQTLRQVERNVLAANNSTMSEVQKLATYDASLNTLVTLAQELNQEEGHVRLSKLRSVRNYKTALEEYAQLMTQLDDNQAQLDKVRQSVSNVIWFFNNQELSTRSLEKQDPETFNHWFAAAKEEWESFEDNRGGYFKAPDQPLNTVLEKTFRSEEPPPKYLSYLFPALLAISLIGVLYVLFARQMKGVGTNALNFGKSPAKLFVPKGSNRVTFKDVAGVDEAIEELQEIVDFLRSPQKFTSLGGRIPKGVLCIGPPGTGKTLIAKAVAGEADRPFFSISGSDFVEMFVGVGASRIRDLFDQAKKSAPCIIFIDEIDAVGRHRGIGIGGGHDEREQTLNQLLVEMDGFDTNEGVILMAATNRPDVLDKALLRPGRFDRRIIINLPDIKGRFDILKVHARKIKLDPAADLMALAKTTPGCSGADLENMLNEAALLAARRGRTAVTMPEIMEARDKVLYGKERRSLELDEQERKTTAYHESGHAVVGMMVKHADLIDKVTIIPRGFSLGSTMFTPKKNRLSYWRQELHDQLAVLMGGRCAEEVFIGDVSSGAQQDIERATSLARSMVCEWGMSEKLGTMTYDERSENGQFLGTSGFHEKKYSEATAKAIDEEVRKILDEAHNTALTIIKDQEAQVDLMAKLLIEFETLDSEDVKKIMDKTWDSEEKKARIKISQEAHKKTSPTPPPPPSFDEKPKSALSVSRNY
jgi:cell division protease FtsH